jgi:hypothetical protein
MNPEQNPAAGPTNQPIPEQTGNPVEASESQRLERESLHIEPVTLLTRCLRGEVYSQIGKYQVYSDHRSDKTVVFMHDLTPDSGHKYIIAQDLSGHTFIVAAPLEEFKYHRNILSVVHSAAGSNGPVLCMGGGLVTVKPDGSLKVFGTSGDFGQGNHEQAKDAFVAAIRKAGSDHEVH